MIQYDFFILQQMKLIDCGLDVFGIRENETTYDVVTTIHTDNPRWEVAHKAFLEIAMVFKILSNQKGLPFKCSTDPAAAEFTISRRLISYFPTDIWDIVGNTLKMIEDENRMEELKQLLE